MKVMLDTNILVSAIFFPTQQTHDLINALAYNHQIFLCDYVIEELRLVTDRKFSSKKLELEYFFVRLPFELVHTPNNIDFDHFPSVRDQKDSPILATAILENIDVFITGDKDFLVLDIDSPKIVTMSEFLSMQSDIPENR